MLILYVLCDWAWAWACSVHNIHTHLVYINIKSIGIRILLVDCANMVSLFTFLDSHTWNLRCCRLVSPLPLISQLVFHLCYYAYSNIDSLYLIPPLASSLLLSLSLFFYFICRSVAFSNLIQYQQIRCQHWPCKLYTVKLQVLFFFIVVVVAVVAVVVFSLLFILTSQQFILNIQHLMNWILRAWITVSTF